MLNIFAFIVGIGALALAIPAAIPFLGWANWAMLPIALFGALLGQFSDSNAGRNFCLIVAVLCLGRLWLGGGLI